MASVVFMRGVNVGGHKTFKPAALVKELAAFDVVNIGAAGTFVVRKPVAQAALRKELGRRLPFAAEIIICPARDVQKLVAADPFSYEKIAADVKRYVTVLARRPGALPPLPLCQPPGDQWQVKLFTITGRFALSLWRRTAARPVYPNIFEKSLGVPCTTRNWTTITAVAAALDRPPTG